MAVRIFWEADGTVHDAYRIEHLRETIRQMSIGIDEGSHADWLLSLERC